MKKIVLLLTCFLVAIVLRSQVNNFNSAPITLQSPEAAQFIRYGDIPMDYSTGVPGISIPLYNVTCGKLSLPIDMSYNASGIKVLDIASTVGLGWSLNAGGLVSRTILGTDDQQNMPKPFLSSTDLENAFNYCHNNLTYYNVQNLVEIIKNIYRNSTQQGESQSDRFFYSFNGRSGIFRTNFQTGVAKTVPYSALKISTGTNNAGPYKITAEDGTNYYFEQPEMSGSYPGYSYYTSYYLTKIESADLTHTINIYYKQDAAVNQYIKNFSLEHKILAAAAGEGAPTIISEVNDNEILSQSTPVMPDRITSDNETVQFEYVSDRPDLRKSRLSRIKILNRLTNETIKIIEFQHSYFGTVSENNQRLRLDNLYIKDNGSTAVQQYGFGYNSTALPPYYHSLGMSEHHNVDYWGYYNAANDVNLLPKEMFDPVREIPNVPLGESYFTPQEKAFYGGNRNPNSATAQACILNEITYPTGGKTNFEYELHQVQNGYAYNPIYPIPEVYGGLRVKKITSTADVISPPVIKTYEYSSGLCTMIQSELYQYHTPSWYWNYIVPVRACFSSTISTDPLIQMSTGSGSLVLYENVTEYDGTASNNNGYTNYIYDYSSLSPYISDPGSGGNPLQNGFYLSDYGNYKPQLKTKIVIGKDQNNNLKEIKKEEYTFDKFNTGSFITGVKIQRNYPFENLGAGITDADAACGSDGIGSQTCQFGLTSLISYYSYSNTLGILDVPLMTQKKETIYPSTGTGNLVTTTDYTYDLVTLQPIKEQSINSKGETIISVNKYPTDFSSVAPYNTMVTRNILTPVIEQSAYKTSISTQNFLKATKTNYDFWNGSNWSSSATNIIVPRTVDSRSKDQSIYETRLRYYSYDDKGNLTTFSKENDVKKTYLWGYDKNYPVAEIIGADYATASSYFTQSVLDNPVSDASLRSHLSNLRNLPGAFVTIYTYKPLVGMTSQTDPNGKTTYYEYDNFNRLYVIRDKDNNIIKKFCYNYAGQPENCACANFSPIWQNTTAALRCQKNATYQNTGYQEQEQRDINPCSPTSNSIRWIVSGYNPTACPAVVNVTISSVNYGNVSGFTAMYTNTTTNQQYSFVIPNVGGLETLGTLPQGKYNLTIYDMTGLHSLLFGSGCNSSSYITGTSASFYNINIDDTDCNTISIDEN